MASAMISNSNTVSLYKLDVSDFNYTSLSFFCFQCCPCRYPSEREGGISFRGGKRGAIFHAGFLIFQPPLANAIIGKAFGGGCPCLLLTPLCCTPLVEPPLQPRGVSMGGRLCFLPTNKPTERMKTIGRSSLEIYCFSALELQGKVAAVPTVAATPPRASTVAVQY
ncbi:hypothetical protein CBL_12911 [Carabus blaptoides fortunei]